MKFYSIQEVTKILNVTAQTLRNWDKTGKLIPNHKTVSGFEIDRDLNAAINLSNYKCS